MTHDFSISPEKRGRIESLKQHLNAILHLNSKELFVQQRWGTINFHDLVDEFEIRLKPIIAALEKLDLSFLNIEEIDLLKNATVGLHISLEDVSQFSIEIQNATTVREEIRSRVHSAMRKIEAISSKHSMPILLQSLSSSSTFISAQNLLGDMKDQLAKSKTEYETTKTANSEIQDILIAARDAAGKIGVVQHAAVFLKESNELQKTACYWLSAMFVMLFLTVGFATYFHLHPVFLMGDMSMAIQVVAAKVVLLILLLTTTVWCGRNYRALAHESSINKHRANALSTFRTFVEATDDTEVKNTVLLEATRSIFVHAPSGYLDKSDNSGSDSRMSDIARSMSSLNRLN